MERWSGINTNAMKLTQSYNNPNNHHLINVKWTSPGGFSLIHPTVYTVHKGIKDTIHSLCRKNGVLSQLVMQHLNLAVSTCMY